MARFPRSMIPKHWRPRSVATGHLASRTGWVVQSGRFQGLRYVAPEPGDWFFPQLLGTYELELAPAFDHQLNSAPIGRIVVAGAAEGYYAVGLATRKPEASVIAFEVDPHRRSQLQEMASKNSIEIEIRGLCDLSSLGRALAAPEQTLLVVDIEGSEALLLDPELLPALGRTRMIVEVHDFMIPFTGRLLESRFAGTHEIQRIDARPRTPSDFPPLDLPLAKLLKGAYLSLMNEGRPADSYWFSLSPRSPAS